MWVTDDNYVIAASENILMQQSLKTYRIYFYRIYNKVHKFHGWGVCVQI